MTHAFLNFSIWMAEARGMWYHLLPTCGPRGRYGQDFIVYENIMSLTHERVLLSLAFSIS